MRAREGEKQAEGNREQYREIQRERQRQYLEGKRERPHDGQSV